MLQCTGSKHACTLCDHHGLHIIYCVHMQLQLAWNVLLGTSAGVGPSTCVDDTMLPCAFLHTFLPYTLLPASASCTGVMHCLTGPVVQQQWRTWTHSAELVRGQCVLRGGGTRPGGKQAARHHRPVAAAEATIRHQNSVAAYACICICVRVLMHGC